MVFFNSITLISFFSLIIIRSLNEVVPSCTLCGAYRVVYCKNPQTKDLLNSKHYINYLHKNLTLPNFAYDDTILKPSLDNHLFELGPRHYDPSKGGLVQT